MVAKYIVLGSSGTRRQAVSAVCFSVKKHTNVLNQTVQLVFSLLSLIYVKEKSFFTEKPLSLID